MIKKGRVMLLSAVFTGVIAFVFYRSIWAMLLWPLVYRFTEKAYLKKRKKEQIQELQEHFMNGLQVLNASLQVGFSMENAWIEVQKETKLLYGDSSEFYLEICKINQSVALNMPIESLFLEFANRCEVEEIIRFAEILDYGKRSGGNWKKIIDNTVLRMTERYEAQKEIEVLLAEKRMEQKIMNVVPIGMILFLQVASWDYIKVLYHNLFGIICMSVCLAIYVLAVLMSEKIMNIQV